MTLRELARWLLEQHNTVTVDGLPILDYELFINDSSIATVGIDHKGEKITLEGAACDVCGMPPSDCDVDQHTSWPEPTTEVVSDEPDQYHVEPDTPSPACAERRGE
jgi:hypothetical protein